MGKDKIYKVENSVNIGMLPGDPKGLPDESFFIQSGKETLVFIDDGFLAKLNKHFGSGKYIKFDKLAFSENLAIKQGLNFKHVFYYTAPPFQGKFPTEEEEEMKRGYDRFIAKLKEDKRITIREGRVQRLKVDGKFLYKQKAVDSLAIIDLMMVPLKYAQIKKIIIISSDSDFVPAIETLKEFGIKTILYTFYQRKRNTGFSRSNHLIKSVHKYVLLSKADFDNAPLIKDKGKHKI